MLLPSCSLLSGVGGFLACLTLRVGGDKSERAHQHSWAEAGGFWSQREQLNQAFSTFSVRSGTGWLDNVHDQRESAHSSILGPMDPFPMGSRRWCPFLWDWQTIFQRSPVWPPVCQSPLIPHRPNQGHDGVESGEWREYSRTLGPDYEASVGVTVHFSGPQLAKCFHRSSRW